MKRTSVASTICLHKARVVAQTSVVLRSSRCLHGIAGPRGHIPGLAHETAGHVRPFEMSFSHASNDKTERPAALPHAPLPSLALTSHPLSRLWPWPPLPALKSSLATPAAPTTLPLQTQTLRVRVDLSPTTTTRAEAQKHARHLLCDTPRQTAPSTTAARWPRCPRQLRKLLRARTVVSHRSPMPPAHRSLAELSPTSGLACEAPHTSCTPIFASPPPTSRPAGALSPRPQLLSPPRQPPPAVSLGAASACSVGVVIAVIVEFMLHKIDFIPQDAADPAKSLDELRALL